MGKRILLIATSHDKLGDSDVPTGTWAEEVVTPYYRLTEAGHSVQIASVKGGKIPVDPDSFKEMFATPDVKKYLEDAELKAVVENSPAFTDVSGEFDAIFLPGGHGVCYDMPNNAALIARLEKQWAGGGIVAAVCHGPAAIVNVKDASGEPIVKGRKVAGFTNTEEEAVGKTKLVPFLLEDRLKELGGLYEKVGDWGAFALVDGQLITGQNPGSSEKVAELIVAALA